MQASIANDEEEAVARAQQRMLADKQKSALARAVRQRLA
jgi:hypothetical protein